MFYITLCQVFLTVIYSYYICFLKNACTQIPLLEILTGRSSMRSGSLYLKSSL